MEVYLPEEVQGEGEVGSSVASTAAGSAASTAPDIASLVEKALAKLPPEMAAEAKDPKMHLILWQWRRMKTTMDVQVLQMKMEEAFV